MCMFSYIVVTPMPLMLIDVQACSTERLCLIMVSSIDVATFVQSQPLRANGVSPPLHAATTLGAHSLPCPRASQLRSHSAALIIACASIVKSVRVLWRLSTMLFRNLAHPYTLPLSDFLIALLHFLLMFLSHPFRSYHALVVPEVLTPLLCFPLPLLSHTVGRHRALSLSELL